MQAKKSKNDEKMLKRKREEKDKHGSNNPNKKPIKSQVSY